DSPEGRLSVCTLARSRLVGNPENAIEVLANFAQDEMGTVITADEVRKHLRQRGFELTNIVGNPTVAGRIEQLQNQFRESLRPSLINASLVPRPETQLVIDEISHGQGNRLIILH